MNVINAADRCRTVIINNGAIHWYVPNDKYELSVGHIISMLDRIVSGEISDEKAHRWLGWAQACICMGNVENLEGLQRINYES